MLTLKTAVKRLPTIAIASCVLILGAWVFDLLTPQLFVVAILYNGPIALSGLALNRRLTFVLVLLAELANVVAGYANGMQGGTIDVVAIGDRALAAASFLLVGYLTARAQDFAREAGSATERARAAGGEKALRRALENVRATLNTELVLRAIVREAIVLFGASEIVLVTSGSQLELPNAYRTMANADDVAVERAPLDAAVAAVVRRATEDPSVATRTGDDAIARMVLDGNDADTLLSVRLAADDAAPVLLVFSPQLARGVRRLTRAFADGAAVALEQARLFMQLGVRNEQIAEQKRELERRNDVIRDIVYALAHDLRTPLSALHVTMEQALGGAYGELPERYHEILRSALASNADVRRLVETLLLIARFESGESSRLEERVVLGCEAARVAKEMLPLAEVEGLSLRVEADGDATMLGDASEIRRAMVNLVANAVAATPRGGNVELRVRDEGYRVAIAVADDGYGVPPERQAFLFERFGSSERVASGGSGLGLYIVRLIAEKYAGTVHYASRSPKGSAFTMYLPSASRTGAGR